MPDRSRTLVAATLAVSLAAAAPASAQQVSPGGTNMPALGNAAHVIVPQARSFALQATAAGIEITSVHARVSILEQTASTTLDIALRNSSSGREEAIVLLPVPDGAVVSSFQFQGAASEASAQVMPADQARDLYAAIVNQVRDPALLEFAGYNLIRSSVFPLESGATQRVRLVYEHLLTAEENRIDYVLPRSESLDGRTPWRISAEVKSRSPISTVYSPSHEITATRRTENDFAIALEGAALAPGPFRLSCLLERDGVSASLFAYPDPTVGGGYFLLMAGLPASIDDLPAQLTREVTIVIDRSGSMAGAKMDQVRAGALQVIEGLSDGEAFNIIDYSSKVSSFAPAAVTKDRASTLAAREYLARIRPTGGTNIHDALLEALRQTPTEGALPIVLFLTDGLPTIGRTSEVAIRNMVEKANVHGRRIFTFGVGEDVNVPLLDRVADATRATSTFVLPADDVEVAVAGVFRKLYGPVFAEPKLRVTDSGGGMTTRLVQDLIPDELPDLFEGDQFILLGQYREEDPVTFTLSGSFLGKPREFSYTFDLASATTRNSFVPRLWASRRIAQLVDEIRQAGAGSMLRPLLADASLMSDPKYAEIVDEILRLSTEFGILTEYTAFLATEGTDLSDWEELRLGCGNHLDDRAVQTRSGRGALTQSLNYRKQRGQVALNYRNAYLDDQLNRVDTATVRQVSDRAFFLKDGQWIDSRLLRANPELKADAVYMFGSEEHLDLLRRLVREGRQGVLSLKGNIMLEVDGRTILITADGC